MAVVAERAHPKRRSLGAGDRLLGEDERDRRALGELEHGLGELARLRVRPVGVLERDDDRLLRASASSQRTYASRIRSALARVRRSLDAQPQQRRPRRGRTSSSSSPRSAPSPARAFVRTAISGFADLGSEPAEQDLR